MSLTFADGAENVVISVNANINTTTIELGRLTFGSSDISWSLGSKRIGVKEMVRVHSVAGLDALVKLHSVVVSDTWKSIRPIETWPGFDRLRGDIRVVQNGVATTVGEIRRGQRPLPRAVAEIESPSLTRAPTALAQATSNTQSHVSTIVGPPGVVGGDGLGSSGLAMGGTVRGRPMTVSPVRDFVLSPTDRAAGANEAPPLRREQSAHIITSAEPLCQQQRPSVAHAVRSAVGSVSATQLVGGLHWVTEQVQSLGDEDREQARDWLMKTFKTSTSLALQSVGAVGEIVAAAKVVTVVLRVAMAIAEAHERANANDVRVARVCARMDELRVIMEQLRDALAEQAANVVSGKTATSTATALRAPLDRLLDAVKAAREAIDAWQEVSRANGSGKWASFKRWVGRAGKSSKHSDVLVEVSDELQNALQQIGAVASIRAALNTASNWQVAGTDADLKSWLTQNAERDDAFRAAMQLDTSEIKQMVTKLLPDIDKLLERHLSSVHAKLDQLLLGDGVKKLPFESFEFAYDLGAGAYGSILAMRCKKLGRALVAVKKLVLTGNAADDKKRKERLREEARLMNLFKHQHIIQFYGQVVTPANEVWLVMELLDTSLEKFIAELAGDQTKWPMADRKRSAHEIALGLEYLHDQGVLHRDLKSGNVMLTAAGAAGAAGERTAKLIDFGLSKDTNSVKNKSSTILGSSSLWMAPELMTNDDFSQASDVYALGVVLTEIVLLELPSMSTLRKVSKMTGEWKALIDMCTEEKPGDRPATVRCAAMLES
jgi:serine/threonine protein kinase